VMHGDRVRGVGNGVYATLRTAEAIADALMALNVR
jgi:hypothetical protein